MLQEGAKVTAEALQIEREICLERRDRKSDDTVQSLAKFIRSHDVVISQEAGGLKCRLASLCPPKRRRARPCTGSQPVSVVLGGVVRANGLPGAGENNLSLQG